MDLKRGRSHGVRGYGPARWCSSLRAAYNSRRGDSAICAGLAFGPKQQRAWRSFCSGDYEANRGGPVGHPRKLPPKRCDPSVELAVPAMLDDGGVVAPTGTEVTVRVIACSEEVLAHMREFHEAEEVVFSFDPDSPYAFPSMDALVPVSPRLGSDQVRSAGHLLLARRRGAPRRRASASTSQRASAKKGYAFRSIPKPKRITTAALLSQTEEVMGICSCIFCLMARSRWGIGFLL